MNAHRVRLDRIWAVALAAAALALFAATACPTFFGGDSAELAAAATLFGVPHPPGYPLYTLTTGLGVRALGFLDPARAANCMSGVYAALTLLALCEVLRTLGVGRLGQVAAVLVLAVGRTFWSQSTVAEVYTFDLLLLALAGNLALRLKPSAPSAVILGTAIGAWIGHRPVNLIYLPSLAIAMGPAVAGGWVGVGGGRGVPGALVRPPRAAGLGGARTTRSMPRLFTCLVLGLLLSSTVYGYLPIASSFDPGIDIGDPETLERFLIVAQGAPYRRHLLSGTWALAGQRVLEFFVQLPREIGCGTLLAPLGFASCMRHHRRIAFAAGLWLATGVAYSAAYNILDIEPYWLPSYAVLAALSGYGLHSLVAPKQEVFTAEAPTTGTPRKQQLLGSSWLALAGLVISSGIAIAANAAHVDLSGHEYARTFAEDLLDSVDDRALLVASGDTTVHALWYLQAVEGRSRDVIVLSPGHLHDWYADQLRERYPEDPWPQGSPNGGQTEWTRAAVDRLSQHRRAYLTLSVDPKPFLQEQSGTRYGTVPRGLAMELLRAGETYNARELAQWNASFFDARARDLRLPGAPLDIDTQSTLLQYALALTRNADLQTRLGIPEGAKRSYAQLLALDPDRLEQNLQSDARRSGVELPLNHFGERARHALSGLYRP